MSRATRLVLASATGLLVATCGLLATVLNAWDRLGVPNTGVNFGDLRVIAIAAQCAAGDPGWSIASVPCLPTMAHYNYPSLWAKGLALMGGSEGWTESIALVLMLLFAVSASVLAYLSLGGRTRMFGWLSVTLACLMPPVWLAFQRGNIDLGVFAVVTSSAGAYVIGWRKTAGLLAGFAAALKLFPVGLIAMLLQRDRSRPGAVVAFAVVGIGGLVLVAGDLALIAQRTPQIDGASFGSGLLPLLAHNRLGWPESLGMAKLVGWLVFVIMVLLLVGAYRAMVHTQTGQALRSAIDATSSDKTAVSLFLAGAGVFLVAYLIGPSYDYRLIFLITAIAGLGRIPNRLTGGLTLLLLLQLALSYSTLVGTAEYVSDGMLTLIAPGLAVISAALLVNTQARTLR